jgi:RHS repeat-associated protein
VILLAEHDEPSLAAKKKRRDVALETATSTPKNRVWNFENTPLGRTCSEPDLSAETAIGSVQYSYESASGQGYYYTRDHLGSVREMLNSSGSIVSRLSYDPYGKMTVVSGTNLPTKQYANYYAHAASGLNLTKYRAFDPNTGRWLSRDPLGTKGGIDLYEYCADDPTYKRDPLGLVGGGGGNPTRCAKTGGFKVEVDLTYNEDILNTIHSIFDMDGPSDLRTFVCKCELKCCYRGMSFQSWDTAFSETVQGPEGLTDTAQQLMHKLNHLGLGIKEEDEDSVTTQTLDTLTDIQTEELLNQLAEKLYNKSLGDFTKKCSDTCKK